MGALPFAADEEHAIELAVVDLRVARAFWEGVPTARLLARIRLDRDERDLVDLGERASGAELASSTWDKLLAKLLAQTPLAHERVKRAVARHGRAASDEGPLAAGDPAICALVHALLSAADGETDSSPAEGAACGAVVDGLVMNACGRLDRRLGGADADRRAAAFEACLRVATRATAGPTSLVVLAALGDRAVSTAPLYPWGDDEVPVADRHALLLERAEVATSGALGTELAPLAVHDGALVAFVVLEPRSSYAPQALSPSSWLPADFASVDAGARLAAALERGAVTAPRARSLVSRGGDAALDAIGAEMLEVTAHPFASAIFADILGRASRERDVVRLVSYFAIAPDVAAGAHALGVCTAKEVSTVLRAWLESILPTDGSVAPPSMKGSSPELSASLRLSQSIAALAPYPHLHAVVEPLLERASDEDDDGRA